ncbi:MAG: hypothetical protein DSY85_12735 [Marinomonas sp.]|nr:MAG: hypothetical protein DSY85_12735 [Marinomonas sp.]
MFHDAFALHKLCSVPNNWAVKPSSLVLGCVFVFGASFTQADTLTLQKAFEEAVKQDPWLSSSVFQEESLRAQAHSIEFLPDPKLSLGLANLPVDSLDINQEAMTQVVIGVSQQFPAGDTLELSSMQLNTRADQAQYARLMRVEQIKKDISVIWSDLYRYYAILEVLKINKELLISLSQSIESNYTAAFNKVNQQAIVNSNLEIVRINERSLQTQQALTQAKSRLIEYLPQMVSIKHYSFADLQQPLIDLDSLEFDFNDLANHPSIRVLDLKYTASDYDGKIAQQQYKPQWGVSMSYGYRAADMNGRSRPDLASIAVNVSLPIFSSQKLDASVEAAESATSSVLYDRELKLNELMAQLATVQSDFAFLSKRINLYKESIIPGFEKSTDTALNAYRSNKSDFRDVIFAQIGQMDAQVELIQMQAEQAKKIAEFKFLTTQSTDGYKNEY